MFPLNRFKVCHPLPHVPGFPWLRVRYKMIRLPVDPHSILAFRACLELRLPVESAGPPVFTRHHLHTCYGFKSRRENHRLTINADDPAVFPYISLRSTLLTYNTFETKFPSLSLWPACVLCTLRYICSLLRSPPATQHSVPNCWLDFVRAAFTGWPDDVRLTAHELLSNLVDEKKSCSNLFSFAIHESHVNINHISHQLISSKFFPALLGVFHQFEDHSYSGINRATAFSLPRSQSHGSEG